MHNLQFLSSVLEHLQAIAIFTSIITFRGKITPIHLYFFLYNRDLFFSLFIKEEIAFLYLLLYILEIAILREYIGAYLTSIIKFPYFRSKNSKIH